MGQHADDAIDAMMMGMGGYHHSGYHGRPSKGKRNPNRLNGTGTPNWKGGNRMDNREVTKKFKMVPGTSGEQSLVIETGVYKEVIAVSFNRSKMRARGFIKSRDSLYNRAGYNEKEVINLHDIFMSLTTVLNNLYSADLLYEESYNNVMDAYEPFINEALDYSEIEGMLDSDGINSTKKKRISRRERGVKK